MKYLSRIVVDRSTAAKRHLMHSYAWHQALWHAFPDANERIFLFRVEEKPSGFLLYLLSETEPDAQAWGNWQTKKISEAFLESSVYRFQLCANPTRRYVNDGNGNRFEKSKRFVVADPEELKSWMLKKAEQGGFSIDIASLQISPPLNQYFYKNGKRGNHKRVEFEGVLSVNDREVFKQTFNRGIGSAKAFGFGLLVLQPIH
ncbi:type I-E CRISPR-associated protein Cas6/Cse3/CasE [Pontiellaceae bacterium B12219]|nr:type I-E CRISPR-associated protein Cas6/Cse3/CasE [Pontiellaceae bacterium B12219]